MTFKINTPNIKVPKVPRKLYIPLGAAVILVTLLFGVVGYQHSVNVRKAQEAADKQATASLLAGKDKQIADLKAQVASEQTRRAAVCTYVSGLATARATRSLVVVPVVACQK